MKVRTDRLHKCCSIGCTKKSEAIRVAASPPHPSRMGEVHAARGATKARQLKLLLKKNFFVSKRNIFATTVRRLYPPSGAMPRCRSQLRQC